MPIDARLVEPLPEVEIIGDFTNNQQIVYINGFHVPQVAHASVRDVGPGTMEVTLRIRVQSVRYEEAQLFSSKGHRYA